MPAFVQLLEKTSLLAFLTGSMMAAGLDLEPRALTGPLRDRRFVVLALALNFLLAPALALALVSIIPLKSGLASGLLLIGGAAGAPFLPKLLQVARGDLARGVALMALLTAGTLVFLPLALPRMIAGFDARPWEIARPMLQWIVAPLLAGMAVRHLKPALAARLSAPLAKAGSLFLLLFLVLLVEVNLKALLGLIGSWALIAAALHAFLLFAAGWWLGGPRLEIRGTLGLGTSARNFGAAMVPAATSLRDPQVLLMLVASAVAGVVVSFSAAIWVKHRTT